MFIAYQQRKFQADSMAVIGQAREICADYAQQGYDLTLRQLYYVFVSRDAIPNTEKSYKRLGSIINDARLAGLLDWNWLVDRGRGRVARGTWDHPREIVLTAARGFHLDWWEDQDVHIEVWVEKQALAGVIERVCYQWDVSSLACKGYMSQSEQHAAGMRMYDHIRDGKRVHIFHLGDHDPSGIDMSRDNEERLRGFIGYHLDEDLDGAGPWDDGTFDWDELASLAANSGWGTPLDADDDPLPLFTFERIALNMDQIRQYNPPPNPAKITDSRAQDYIARFGRQSWELDALPPQVLNDLIEAAIVAEVDAEKFAARRQLEATYKDRVQLLLDRHGDVLDGAA